MDSLFNIFGSQEQTVKLQKSLFPGPVSDPVSLKQRTKSDSSSVQTKRVLGDIRNTIQQSAKKYDGKENPPVKGKSPVAGCSRSPLLPKPHPNTKTPSVGGLKTPLLSKPQQHAMTVSKIQTKSFLKYQTPTAPKFLEVPKTCGKPLQFKIREEPAPKTGTPSSASSSVISPVIPELYLGTPEKQGQDLHPEDNYEDILPASERPTLDDYKRIMDFKPDHVETDDDSSLSLESDSPKQENVFMEDILQSLHVVQTDDLAVGKTSPDPYDILEEPQTQGMPPFIEDTYEDIFPASELPTLDDYKNAAIFWLYEKPDESPDPIQLEEDACILLDVVFPPIEEAVFEGEIFIPQPSV